MLESQRPSEAGPIIALDPETGQSVLFRLDALVRAAEENNQQPVLACAPQVRAALRRLLRPTLPSLPILSYTELIGGGQVRSVGVVTAEPVAVNA